MIRGRLLACGLLVTGTLLTASACGYQSPRSTICFQSRQLGHDLGPFMSNPLGGRNFQNIASDIGGALTDKNIQNSTYKNLQSALSTADQLTTKILKEGTNAASPQEMKALDNAVQAVDLQLGATCSQLQNK